MEGTAAGRDARPDAAAQGSWRQERSALQSQLLPFGGTLAGCAARLIARRWRGAPARIVIPLRAVVS